MTIFSVFVYFVFLLASLVPLLENVPNFQERSFVRCSKYVSGRFLKKFSKAGDNMSETMMYTYHISNRTDCNGPRLYQACQ